MKNIYKKYIGVTAFAVLLGMAVAVPAFAQTNTGTATNPTGSAWQGRGMMNGMPPGIGGLVTSNNGSTLTVDSHSPRATATTTYTVNVSSATTVTKNNVASTLSNVAVGDRVFVAGTVSGTTVTATSIRDGMMMRGGRGGGTPGNPNAPGAGGNRQNQTPPIKGNGEPVVAGTVSVVNGSTLTITTTSNTSYTIDASSAVVSKNGASGTVSSVATGDYIVVQGTVNGNSVTAVSIIDNGTPPTPSQSGGTPPAQHSGFFGSIGSFFKHLFGF